LEGGVHASREKFFDYGCGQSLTTNVLKRLVDQLEKRILQIDQSKIALKHLKHRVDYITWIASNNHSDS